MIPIPESVKVQRNSNDEKWLLKKSEAWLTKDERKKGLHASDFLDLRRAFWRTVDPQPLSDREIGVFLPGKILHAFVLGAAGDDGLVNLGVSDAGSRYSDDLGIWYSPDWDKTDIAEFKTSRAFQEPKTLEDLDIYVEQVLIYLACEKKTKAKIWVLYLNLRDKETRRTTPSFRCFEVEISPEDLERTREFIKVGKADFDQAIETQDWKHLDLCREWLCGAKNCTWYARCQPEGRYGTPEFDKA